MTCYTDRNFTTKKQLKEALARGERLTVYSPELYQPTPVPKDGKVSVCGPHFPQPHKWYAQITLKDGVITKVS